MTPLNNLNDYCLLNLSDLSKNLSIEEIIYFLTYLTNSSEMMKEKFEFHFRHSKRSSLYMNAIQIIFPMINCYFNDSMRVF